MKALTWHGKGDMRCESVPDPKIEHPRDAIIKVTGCAICGSDLHIYDGVIPSMEKGDVLGHETMGEVVEVGRGEQEAQGRRSRGGAVHDRLRRVLLLQTRAVLGLRAHQSRSRQGREAVGAFAGGPVRLFASSGRLCGRPGRVSCASPMPMSVRSRCRTASSDEQVLFLSDIFPTGYMAADFCNIQPGDTIAIWGCGPVGQFAIRSAFLLGAERVIAIDTVPERLALAREAGAQTLDFKKEDIYDRIQELTHGRGADACIDAVGTEADTTGERRFGRRSGEGRDLHGNRPAACPAPSHPLLPQLRHGLDRRRLWRLPRQDSRWARRSIAA